MNRQNIRTSMFGISCLTAAYFTAKNSFPNFVFLIYCLAVSGFFLTFLTHKNHLKIVKQHIVDLAIYVGLCLATLSLYLYRITEITPGVWGDEVALGWMAKQLQALGHFTPFLSYNLGHPTPLIYTSIISITIFGQTILGLRMVSVVCGALSVAIFYLLLRRFFDKFFSSLGAILLSTSYVFVIISRFAYEMSAAILCLISSLLFLDVYRKKPSPETAALLGGVCGLGLYTYLAFRTILPLIILAAIAIAWRQNKNRKTLITFGISLLIVTLPLLSYGIRNPKAINERVNSLDVFQQNLSTQEIAREILGASGRTFSMFIMTGDPNPRQNPANTTPFDIATSVLFLFGLGYLLFKQRSVGAFVTTLTLTVICTEIITLEKIPEFHYYGLGHPNTLRISLILPAVIFAATWGIKILSEHIPKKYGKYAAVGVVIIIALVNLNRYFNQPPNKWIYVTNFVVPMKVITTLNSTKPKTVSLSKSLYESQHVKYFLDPEIQVGEIPTSADCIFSDISLTPSIYASADLASCTNEELQKLAQNENFTLSITTSPWNTIDTVTISKK